jgi:hypothetical protein
MIVLSSVGEILVSAPDATGEGPSGLLVLLWLAGLAAAGYVVSVILHPYKPCPRCKGNPRKFGAVYTKSFRLCPHCEGRGRVRRFGAGRE